MASQKGEEKRLFNYFFRWNFACRYFTRMFVLSNIALKYFFHFYKIQTNLHAYKICLFVLSKIINLCFLKFQFVLHIFLLLLFNSTLFVKRLQQHLKSISYLEKKKPVILLYLIINRSNAPFLRNIFASFAYKFKSTSETYEVKF